MKPLYEIMKQNCFNEYNETDNKKYNGFEYFISDSKIIYIYKCTKLVFSRELINDDRKYLDNWVKYFINQLPHTIDYNDSTLINTESGLLYSKETFEPIGIHNN